MRSIHLFLISLILLFPINALTNEIIILKDGREFKTNYIWKTKGKINCFSEGKEYHFNNNEVQEITEEKIVNLKQQNFKSNSYNNTLNNSQLVSTDQNPISSVPRNRAMEDIKKKLAERYSGSYSTQKMLLDNNMQAYDKLSRLPSTKINIEILSKLKSRYYPSFSTIAMLYENNIKAYNDLHKN